MQQISWDDVDKQTSRIAETWANHPNIDNIYGIPRGGIPPAIQVANKLGLPLTDTPTTHNTLVIDDLVDSGATAEQHNTTHFDALYRKPYSPPHLAPHADLQTDWLVFPWEQNTSEQHGPTDAIRRILEHIGENPNRDGLQDTPKRVLKTFNELCAGYTQHPETFLNVTFDITPDPNHELVAVHNIAFTSLCEHHLLPFQGHAHVAYIPNKKIVGLSKIPRVVNLYAQRLQVQERLTQQISDAIYQHLQPHAAITTITSHHSCMGIRGIQKPDATMTTTSVRGDLPDRLRQEFMANT